MPLSALLLDDKQVISLKHCPKDVREAVLQLIKFHANFSRAKTNDDFCVELAQSFLTYTAPEGIKKTSPRMEETIPTPASSLNAIR